MKIEDDNDGVEDLPERIGNRKTARGALDAVDSQLVDIERRQEFSHWGQWDRPDRSLIGAAEKQVSGCKMISFSRSCVSVGILLLQCSRTSQELNDRVYLVYSCCNLLLTIPSHLHSLHSLLLLPPRSISASPTTRNPPLHSRLRLPSSGGS